MFQVKYRGVAIAVMFVLFSIFSDSCKKQEENKVVVLETDSMTDIDGNVYKTVKIGSQWWMAENLKVRKYRNGQYLFTATSNPPYILWDTMTTGALCYFNGNINDSAGYLYNWFAISDTNNIAPVGWHVPTDEEWKQLEMSIGMASADADKSGWRGTHEGEKLKKQGMNYWTPYEDVWATNESGFTALAGGCRMFNGTTAFNLWSYPSDRLSSGFWWSTSAGDSEAWYRYLDYKNANVFRGKASKNYGFSIRCVKNN